MGNTTAGPAPSTLEILQTFYEEVVPEATKTEEELNVIIAKVHASARPREVRGLVGAGEGWRGDKTPSPFPGPQYLCVGPSGLLDVVVCCAGLFRGCMHAMHLASFDV